MPDVTIRDKHAMYQRIQRNTRPLAEASPGQSEPLGKFVQIEHSNTGRFHIDITQGAPAKSYNRLASIIWKQIDTHPGARLNVLLAGKEVSLGLIRSLTRRKLIKLLKQYSKEGGTFVVVSEATGGALSDKALRHPARAEELSRW
jgi:hypothetical protein